MRRQTTVLVVDKGGRGSVLVDKYAQSKHVDRIIAVPGNDLMQVNSNKPVRIYPHLKTTSVAEILQICKRENVSLADVAQDNAVEVGLADALIQNGILTVGPTRNAGRIEWDKVWAREFGKKYKLPQPFFKTFHSQKDGVKYIRSQRDQKWFIKASGLAEGKGVLPAHNNAEAIKRISELKKNFKDAAKDYLIEKWFGGEEFSTFVLVDGNNFKIIGSAQDHKRTCNFDIGENTGGMGCSTPPRLLTPKIQKEYMQSSRRQSLVLKKKVDHTKVSYILVE
ncbi:hypothetical protein CMO96_02390 [Candidatus Woesebacteria bacterium]|nr:hypothetical protein [Candidatus Woesebacteria bacterium]|tara:strand:+ start:2378 stop:3217 length:840 start_codon:yes stop_codon:yes gene_type:complete